MTIGLDVLAIVGLVGLSTQLSKGKPVFWTALVTGLGLLAIRLNGDASWWSGHLFSHSVRERVLKSSADAVIKSCPGCALDPIRHFEPARDASAAAMTGSAAVTSR